NGIALGPGAAISGENATVLRAVIDGINAGRAGATQQPAPVGTQLTELVGQMSQGQVGLILIDAANPAYTLPASLGFADALRMVPTRVSFSSFLDETSTLCSHVLPDHHFLEAWGDYEPQPGVL